MIERVFSAIRPAASILVDKNLEIGIPAGLVVLLMASILSIHRPCQLPSPQAAGALAGAHRCAMETDDFSRTLCSEPPYAILIRVVPRFAARHGMKRKGVVDDENEDVFEYCAGGGGHALSRRRVAARTGTG